MTNTNNNTRGFGWNIESFRTSHFVKNVMNLHYIQMREQSNQSNIVNVHNPITTGNRFQNKWRVCGFCKTNGESPNVYTSHHLKDKLGKTVCPILRKHVCEICSETGDNAHTKSHCPTAQQIKTNPVIRDIMGGLAYFNNSVVLKKTRLNSAGRVRRNC